MSNWVFVNNLRVQIRCDRREARFSGWILAGKIPVARSARPMGCPICGRYEITVPYRTESVIYIACNGCGSVSPADLTLMAKRYVDRPAPVQTSDEGSRLFSQASSDITADDESATTAEASG